MNRYPLIGAISGTKETKPLLGGDDKTTKNPEQQQQQPLKETLPLKPPEPSPSVNQQLYQLTINSLFKKTLEETITNWRLELESQTSKMSHLTNICRKLESNLLSNFDMEHSLNSVSQKLQNVESSLSQLKDINTEEEQIIEQLNYMNKSLTDCLNHYKIGNDKDFEMYNSISEMAVKIDGIGEEIARATNVQMKTEMGERRGNYGFEYENEETKEKMFIDQQEMNDIFNGFYVAIRLIKNMEETLYNKINSVEMEINEKKKEVMNSRNGKFGDN